MKRITILCDNSASVWTLNTGRTRYKTMLALLREIAFTCAQVNCHIRAVHLPGIQNWLADQLSRRPLNPEIDVNSLVDPTWQEVVVDESLFAMDHDW